METAKHRDRWIGNRWKEEKMHIQRRNGEIQKI